MTSSRSSVPRVLRAVAVVSTFALAACSSSGAGSPGASLAVAASQAPAVIPSAASPVPPDSAPPSAAVTPAASPSPEPSGPDATAVATALDPCQLVTSDEAGALAGVAFGPGDESTTDNGARLCSYGQEGVVFEVITATGSDPAAAKQQEAEAKAELEANAPGFPYQLTELPGFAPGVDAAVVEGSAKIGGTSLSGVAIYLVKGTTFVGISDIATGTKAPSSARMQDQAKVTLGRIP